ncbi:MAG: TolC family protein [bacterium]|nr:TolC family protein [bacterium]
MAFRFSTIAVLLLLSVVPVVRGATPLGVGEAVELALASDRRVFEAESSYEAAQAATLAAWGSYMPLLGFTGGYLRNWTGPSTMSFSDENLGLDYELQVPESVDNRLSLGANATLYLFRGGEDYGGITAANHAQAAADANVDAVKARVAYDARSAYVNLYRANALLASAERSLDTAEEQLRFSRALAEVGSISDADALKAQAADDAAALRVIEARNSARVAAANLAFICGLEVFEEIDITETLEVSPRVGSLDEALELLRSGSPEMRLAEEGAAEAAARAGAASSNYWPQLALRGAYSWSEDTPLLQDPLAENYNFTLGAYLTWTPFDNFATEARRAAARLDDLRARLARRDTTRQLELQLRLALSEIDAGRESVGVAKTSYERAKGDLELAQRKLELGSGTVLAALEAEANLSSAETALADARAGYALACYNLDRLLGVVP